MNVLSLLLRECRSVCLLLPLLLAACSSSQEPPSIILPEAIPSPTTIVETPTPSLTPLVALDPLAPEPTEALLPPTPTFHVTPPSTQTIESMPIFFPTVTPVEGAEYRPPLYPIPWALSPHDHFYFAWPLPAWYPSDPVQDYRYGGTYFGPDIIHTGIDLPAPRGTDVLAAGPGTVVWSGYGLFSGLKNNQKDPYGIAIAIRHDFGYRYQPLYTLYAHLSETNVIVGQWVQTGEVIGKVGDTGVTTGPHLHFEVRLGKNTFYDTRNPELWLVPPQGYGVLAARIMRTYGDLLEGQAVYLRHLESGKRYEGRSYINFNVIPDDYYRENLVIGNLPAGVYEIVINYGDLPYRAKFQILPGQVNFFKFYGHKGFYFESPATPTPRP